MIFLLKVLKFGFFFKKKLLCGNKFSCDIQLAFSWDVYRLLIEKTEI